MSLSDINNSVDSCGENKTDTNDKNNHRTHHTRFFEKLYGNLEKSSNEIKPQENINYPLKINVNHDIINSPSESSGSSSSDINVTRCI